MNFNIILILFIPVAIALVYFWNKEQKQKQLYFIQSYKFSPVLIKRIKQKHNYLSDADIQKVIRALRDYFYICNKADGKMVAMPSEIVDVAWHEFLLFTRDYQLFCQKGIGRFLHHTPTEAMKSKKSAQEGIKRAWRLACAKEGINPKHPKKLPALFAIDKVLKIEGGFHYQLSCKSKPIGSNSSSCGGYCATDIGCTSGCGGDSGGSSCSSCGSSSCGGGGE